MEEVRWIKIVTDIFDDEKILLIDGLPERDGIIVIWFKLLCLAGKQNNGGVFKLNDKISYTDEMLATIFHRPLTLVRLALETFVQFGMVEMIEDTVTIPNWGKHQNLEAIAAQKQKSRERVAKYREKQRLIASVNDCNTDVTQESVTCNVTGNANVTQCNAIEEDIDKEEDKEEYKKEGSPPARTTPCPFEKIKNLYHSICVSYPKIKAIGGKRRDAVSARWRNYKELEVFEELFRIAESSSFLKGENKNNWSADFDWMMKANNFSKILEHRYDDKTVSSTPSTTSPARPPNGFSQSQSGNPFLDMLRDFEEQEMKEIDVQGNITDNGDT